VLHSEAVFFELVRNAGHVVGTKVPERRQVLLVLLHATRELVGVGDVTHFVHILNLLVVERDQDARNYWLGNAPLFADISELDEFVRVPELLGDDEVCTFVTLSLELVNTLF